MGHNFLLDEQGSVSNVTNTGQTNANHIGISTLAIFKKEKIVAFVIQGLRNDKSGELRAPSGSGSMDYDKDVGSSSSGQLKSLLTHAMNRELSEESGIPLAAIERTLIIGYARLLHRGGKPEYFGVSLVKFDIASMNIARAEKIFTHEHELFELDCSNIETLKKCISNKIELMMAQPDTSIVLILNLTFLLDYLELHSSEFDCLYDPHDKAPV